MIPIIRLIIDKELRLINIMEEERYLRNIRQAHMPVQLVQFGVTDKFDLWNILHLRHYLLKIIRAYTKKISKTKKLNIISLNTSRLSKYVL